VYPDRGRTSRAAEWLAPGGEDQLLCRHRKWREEVRGIRFSRLTLRPATGTAPRAIPAWIACEWHDSTLARKLTMRR